jgi:plasmid stabilization system protein ParE
MAHAVWTRQAEADLEAIYDFIARRDRRLSFAKKVVRKLRDHCDHYAELVAAGHQIGTARGDLAPEVCIFTHQRWVVVFRPTLTGIEVLRIYDGSRDFPQLFRNEFGV